MMTSRLPYDGTQLSVTQAKHAIYAPSMIKKINPNKSNDLEPVTGENSI